MSDGLMASKRPWELPTPIDDIRSHGYLDIDYRLVEIRLDVPLLKEQHRSLLSCGALLGSSTILQG